MTSEESVKSRYDINVHTGLVDVHRKILPKHFNTIYVMHILKINIIMIESIRNSVFTVQLLGAWGNVAANYIAR